MGRQVRRVKADWVHPTDSDGRFIPLFEGKDIEEEQAEWDLKNSKWSEGLRSDYRGGWVPLDEDEVGYTWSEWSGGRPDADYYMPKWSPEEATHLMMYEDTTEGTPISPAFASPEELARWLADTGASSFGRSTATYEQWLHVANDGWAPSFIVDANGIRSGVEALGSMS